MSLPKEAQTPASQEKLKSVLDKVKRVAGEQREKETDSLLDRLIAKAGGIDNVQKKLDARRAQGNEGQKNDINILSQDQRADLANGEKDARVTSEVHREYRVDQNNSDRVLTEITTSQDGNTTRIDYTYNDAGTMSRKVTEHKSGVATFKNDERYDYDDQGALQEEHGARMILRPGIDPMGSYRDVLYMNTNDPRVQDPMTLKGLQKTFSYIGVRDESGILKAEYGFGPQGFSSKNNSGEYEGGSVDVSTQFSYDLKGRIKTEDRYDGDALQASYSYVYADRPDGSYDKTRKDITPGKVKPDADVVQEFDANGRLVAEQNHNGNVYSERTYRADGKLATISRLVRSAEGVPRYEKAGRKYMAFTYDSNGRQESVTHKELDEQ